MTNCKSDLWQDSLVWKMLILPLPSLRTFTKYYSMVILSISSIDSLFLQASLSRIKHDMQWLRESKQFSWYDSLFPLTTKNLGFIETGCQTTSAGFCLKRHLLVVVASYVSHVFTLQVLFGFLVHHLRRVFRELEIQTWVELRHNPWGIDPGIRLTLKSSLRAKD